MLLVATDSVWERFVYSGKLLAMSPAEVEGFIHEPAAEVRAKVYPPPPQPSLATSLDSPMPYQKSGAVSHVSLNCATPTKRGRPKKIVPDEILRGPGPLKEKARRAGVSMATISRLMAAMREGSQ